MTNGRFQKAQTLVKQITNGLMFTAGKSVYRMEMELYQ